MSSQKQAGHNTIGQTLAETTFVVVDLETTGLSPDRAEIIEIGAIKIQNGEPIERFHTLIRPKGRIPQQITQLTGIHYEMVQDKPSLEEILPAFLHFLGDAVMVAHNLPFDRKFLAAAVFDVMGTTLPNEGVCTCRMARKLLPALPSKGLDALSSHFHLVNEDRHRAMGDAEVTGQLLRILLEMMSENFQVTTLPGLLAFSSMTPKALKAGGMIPFYDIKKGDYPKVPGVYFMKGALGEILYIGKAKNLRNRLQSYFTNPLNQPRKVVEMMRQVKTIDYEVLGSELEALLKEAQLIKHHQPFFNRQIKNYKALPFISISLGDPYPRVTLTQELEEEAALYFGPFTNKGQLALTLEGLNRVFKLRTCTNAMFQKYHFSPCIEYHVQQCSGPCAGLVSEERYQEDVLDLIAFLEGRATTLMQRLVEERDRLTDSLAFEEAGMVHQQMLHLLQLQSRSSMLVRAVHQNHCLVLLPSGQTGVWKVLYVLNGRPVNSEAFDPQADSFEELAERVLSSRAFVERTAEDNSKLFSLHSGVLIPKESFEETRIIAQWLQQREPDDGIVLPLLSEEPDRLLKKLQEKLYGPMAVAHGVTRSRSAKPVASLMAE